MADGNGGNAWQNNLVLSTIEALRRDLEKLRDSMMSQSESRQSNEVRIAQLHAEVEELKKHTQQIGDLEEYVMIARHDAKKRDKILWIIGAAALGGLTQQAISLLNSVWK